jgi:hypothetical protein
MRVAHLLRLAALLIFAGFLATAVLFLPDDLQFLSEAQRIRGEVVAVDTRREAIFSYKVARVKLPIGDTIFHYPVEVNLFDDVAVGEQRELLYNPGMAPSLRFDTPFGRYQSLGVFVLIAMGITAALIVRLVLGLVFPRSRADRP